MITALTRKAGNVLHDPALRRWLMGRALRRYTAPPPFTPHRPPYLNGVRLDAAPPRPPTPFAALRAAPPDGPLTLDLPGETVTIDPGAPDALFAQAFADTETLLAAYRFAWLPLMRNAAPADWVDALWRAWMDRFAVPDDSWAWHPYTAAERAINILRFARVRGLPGDSGATLRALARHAPAIAAKLEYFGDHDTGNHLSNNGRGLYLIGLALGLDDAAGAGARILLAEAERIFTPSGLLREGSSHYHLLVARNYVEAWLAARAHGRAEAADLEAVARAALEAAPVLALPGGMPLIGDISPDCPPDFLTCLLPGGAPEGGWAELLDDDARAALADMTAGLHPVSPTRAGADGWHELNAAPWSLLAFVAPQGWPPMPGHAHQDMGSFELHHGATPVIVDPGRGAYGASGEAAAYASARLHNGLTIDETESYPPNKPYYSAAFRREVGGPPPRADLQDAALTIAHDGFARLGSAGTASRRIAAQPGRVTVEDTVEGRGRHILTRRLHTTLAVVPDGAGNGVALEGANGLRLHIVADGPIRCQAAKRWTAYGRSTPATALEITRNATLPARLTLEIAVA